MKDLHDCWLRVAGREEESIVDGPGLRYVLFTQGCPRRCPGCHNPETLDPNGGVLVRLDAILNHILKNPLIHRVTFSGGEPFMQAEELMPLAEELAGRGYHLMAYSGYTYEELVEDPCKKALLELMDILADGPFIEEEKTLERPFIGSKNQRLLDVKASLKEGRPVLWQAV